MIGTEYEVGDFEIFQVYYKSTLAGLGLRSLIEVELFQGSKSLDCDLCCLQLPG